MSREIHVIGAGLSGLAAAVRLSAAPDLRITVWEATRRAGGRCWSFHDKALGRTIDNGNHLMLSGNRAVLDYVRRIGAERHLQVAERAAFPFVDLADGSRWTIRVPRGLTEILRARTGLPGSSAAFGRDLLRLLRAGPTQSVAAVLADRGPLWHRFWEPLSLAVLNEPADRGAAALLAAVFRRTLLRGGGASRPILATGGLGPALVDPAVAHLRARGVRIVWGAPLATVEQEGRRVGALGFSDGERVRLADGDGVVAAAASAGAIFPGGTPPGPGETILNAHFRVPAADAENFPPILGVVSGAAHWIFRRGDVLSVTVSAADATGLAALPRDAALDRLFADLVAASGRPGLDCVARRLVRAPAATTDQSPDGVASRPAADPGLDNVVLAGDHVRGALPASIEAAILSGDAAAREMLRREPSARGARRRRLRGGDRAGSPPVAAGRI